MPRVNTQTKSNRGRTLHCGRCGATILPTETYFSWSFRYGGTRTNCHRHPPRSSELTQSKMAEVYAAIESAEDQLDGCTTIEDIKDQVTDVASTVQEVAGEYRDAAEAFGGQGENAERADELDSWADELESFDPDEPPDPDDDEPAQASLPVDPERTTEYDVPATGRPHQVERDVHHHAFEALGPDQWAVRVYDQWWVDEHGKWEADGGVQRRVALNPPGLGGGSDTIAGMAIERDSAARHERLRAANPPPPPPKPADHDYVGEARDAAAELLGGCPL